MALKTKKEIVDEILYEAYSGTPPDNASITPQFVLRGVNNLIAEMAVKSAYATNGAEGVTYADDVFYITYNNLQLTMDEANGLRYVELPAQPIGLPRDRSFRVYPTVPLKGRNSDCFKPIPARDVHLVMNMPRSSKIYHFTENGRRYFITSNIWFPQQSAINMVIASSGANNLSAILNLPEDMIMAIKSAMVVTVRKMMGTADQLPQTNQTPQPR